MLHPTAYEMAVSYFLEEFAGDTAFVRASDPEQMPHLVSILGNVVSKAVGNVVELERALVSYLRAHRFVHGNARAAGHIVAVTPRRGISTRPQTVSALPLPLCLLRLPGFRATLYLRQPVLSRQSCNRPFEPIGPSRSAKLPAALVRSSSQTL